MRCDYVAGSQLTLQDVCLLGEIIVILLTTSVAAKFRCLLLACLIGINEGWIDFFFHAVSHG